MDISACVASSEPTLEVVFRQYKKTGRLKESTANGYSKALRRCFADWLDLPVFTITKDMVQERHQDLSASAPALANLSMRILKALLNFARAKYDRSNWTNPVVRLSEVRAWNRIKKRKDMIQPVQMPAFYQAALSLHNTVVRDYFLFVLFTGVRKMEGARLAWDSDVDFDARKITIRDTKNGDDYEIPMTEYLFDLLHARYLRRRSMRNASPYVFQGRKPGSHLIDWRNSLATLTARAGFNFTIHSLRRTFITTADSLDIQKHIIKRLVNHRSRDVTDDYIISSIDRLRRPMEQVNERLLMLAITPPVQDRNPINRKPSEVSHEWQH